MSYVMRFFVEEPPIPTYAELEALFASLPHGPRLSDGILSEEGREYAQIEILTREDDLLADELEEFQESVADLRVFWNKRKVLQTLKNTQAIVSAEVFLGTGDLNETVEKIYPLFNHLISTLRGLVQADGEGFYEGRKLILKLE